MIDICKEFGIKFDVNYNEKRQWLYVLLGPMK